MKRYYDQALANKESTVQCTDSLRSLDAARWGCAAQVNSTLDHQNHEVLTWWFEMPHWQLHLQFLSPHAAVWKKKGCAAQSGRYKGTSPCSNGLTRRPTTKGPGRGMAILSNRCGLWLSRLSNCLVLSRESNRHKFVQEFTTSFFLPQWHQTNQMGRGTGHHYRNSEAVI